jgi:uracil-DNA glycosylase family 4
MKLPIYKDMTTPRADVELATPADREHLPPAGRYGRKCDRCPLGSRKELYNPCMPAMAMGEGEGGLLVIGETVGAVEDRAGKLFAGSNGLMLRQIVHKHWKGPVTYDNALRCSPGSVKIKDKMVRACRGFLLQTIMETRPSRIITVGAWAAYSLFGRSVPALSSRGAYGWLRGGEDLGFDYGPIAVFMTIPPGLASRNHFVRRWFEEDLVFALTSPDPPAGPWESEASVVEDEMQALAAERELMANDWVSFDVETMGHMWTPEFRMISCAVLGNLDDEQPWVWDEKALYDPALRAPLERLLMSRKVPKVGSNVKYDQLAWRAAFGVRVGPIVGDTRLTRKLLDPEAAGKLASMAELVGMGGLKQDAEDRMTEIKSKVKRRVRKQWAAKKPKPLTPDEAIVPDFDLHPEIDAVMRKATPDEVDDLAERYQYGMLPHAELVAYNARDAIATARVENYVRERLEQEPELSRIWRDVVLPGSVALERVEAWGIGASVNAITAFDKFLSAKEQVIAKKLSAYKIDWNSNQQIAELFFGQLKLPIIKRTPTGAPSTDEEVLKVLEKKHHICASLVEYRSVTKLKGTYASGMLPHIRPDGRIHPNIKLDGARSGRTSCTDPNLQNIPRAQTDEGKMARDCFIAAVMAGSGKRKRLLEVDYSQLELRVAAMLSGDPLMIQIFESGVDYHLRTAQLIAQVAWNIKPEQVTDQHRSWAKSVNFGILYGKTARTLAAEWGIAISKAEAIVAAIMGQFKVLDKWCRARRSEAEKTGEVWTWWAGERARRRPLYRIADQGNDGAASTARNGAVNSPIQGTASEFCVASLIEVVKWIEEEGLEDNVKLTLAVHDSLLLEVDEDMVDETAYTVNEIMMGHDSKNVPLVVDFKVGPSWGSMEKYTLPHAA